VKRLVSKRYISFRLRHITIVLGIFLPCLGWAWPTTLPVPSGVLVSVVGEEMLVNGIPVRAYEYFWRNDKQSLLDFYSNLWHEDNANDEKPSVIKMLLGEWNVLSHLEDGYNVTVQYKEDGIKGVRVLLGISPLPRMLDKNRLGRIESKIKLLPGMTMLSVVESVDAGVRSETHWIDSSNSIEKTAQILGRYYSDEGFFVNRKNIKHAESGELSSSFLRAEDSTQLVSFSINELDGYTKVIGVWREK
jgi:hypothetical protein